MTTTAVNQQAHLILNVSTHFEQLSQTKTKKKTKVGENLGELETSSVFLRILNLHKRQMRKKNPPITTNGKHFRECCFLKMYN